MHFAGGCRIVEHYSCCEMFSIAVNCYHVVEKTPISVVQSSKSSLKS